MSKEHTSSSKRDHLGMTSEDWQRFHSMTEDEIAAAALADPDAQPIPDEQLAKARRPALAKVVRQRLVMSQEMFASTYGIPLDALRAWERHETLPTAAELTYLRLIEREPETAKLVPAK